jgi:hypothetical protein
VHSFSQGRPPRCAGLASNHVLPFCDRHRVLLSPATPPGMRVRTGRFEKLRSAETGYFQPVGPFPVEYGVEEHPAVAPAAPRVGRYRCRDVDGSSQGHEFLTPPPLGHKSFAVLGPLALVGCAFYPALVHRPAASSPHPVTLMQLRFASLAVTSSQRDFHPQECAHAGRTQRKRPQRELQPYLGSFWFREITRSDRSPYSRRAPPPARVV